MGKRAVGHNKAGTGAGVARGRPSVGACATSDPAATQLMLLPTAVVTVLLVAVAVVLVIPRSSSAVTTPEASREHAAYILGDSPSARAAQARALLQALVEDGAVLHTPVQLAEHATTGLGIYAARKLLRGQPIFTLPSRHMIRPATGGPEGIGVAAVLLQELRQPSSKAMQLFTASLPRGCPPNIATRSRTASDLALVSLSLHAWKTELLRAELEFLRSAFASGSAATESEAEWSTCMLLSRAFGSQDDPQVNKVAGHGVVMVPFVDMLNHGKLTVNHTISAAGGAVLVAAEDVEVGPSRARLLTSFGFDAAPSASLMASDVPQRDANWLAERGCSGDALRRIELHLVKDPSSGAKLGLTERGVREALRCIRLQVFTSEEAELAISSGYIDLPWNDSTATRTKHLQALVRKDRMIAQNTAKLCGGTMSTMPLRDLVTALAAEDVSEDLRDSIEDEVLALQECTKILHDAAASLSARL